MTKKILLIITGILLLSIFYLQGFNHGLEANIFESLKDKGKKFVKKGFICYPIIKDGVPMIKCRWRF